jgi:hypothetical protein
MKETMAGRGDGDVLIDDGDATIEATPLLSTDSDTTSVSPPAERHWRRTMFFILGTLFCLEFGFGLLLPGVTAALEQKICDAVYVDQQGIAVDCKAPAVQGKLATLRGWQETTEAIASRLNFSNFIWHCPMGY